MGTDAFLQIASSSIFALKKEKGFSWIAQIFGL
jgi:hypothetical protein